MADLGESRCRVVVVDYDSSWPTAFEALRQEIWAAVCNVALSIEHVGSTAVPELAAKPVIDMDVIVAARDRVAEAIARLGALGYVHQGNLGIEDREAFASPPGRPAHHLYLCIQDSGALANHLALRNYLRRNPAAAAKYGRLKKQLAAEFPNDANSYGAGKTDYILTMLRSASVPESWLQAIRDARLPPLNR
jgi:GrpB-like predicted nucleotidyltransferase (UPF0157 family)